MRQANGPILEEEESLYEAKQLDEINIEYGSLAARRQTLERQLIEAKADISFLEV